MFEDSFIIISLADLAALMAAVAAGYDPEEVLTEYFASLIEGNQDVIADAASE